MMYTPRSVPIAWVANSHDDALNRTWKNHLVEQGVKFLLHRIRIRQSAGMPQVEIENHFMISRNFVDE